MLLDQVTDTQMRAAQIIGGATMIVMIAAPMLGRHAHTVRVAFAVVYIGVLISAIGYFLL